MEQLFHLSAWEIQNYVGRFFWGCAIGALAIIFYRKRQRKKTRSKFIKIDQQLNQNYTGRSIKGLLIQISGEHGRKDRMVERTWREITGRYRSFNRQKLDLNFYNKLLIYSNEEN